MTDDVIDRLAGLQPGDPVQELREQRRQAKDNAQRSFTALLEPASTGGFTRTERYAVATFVAGVHRFDTATQFYSDQLTAQDPATATAIAALIDEAGSTGPFGTYREPDLASESVDGTVWVANPGSSVGQRLGAALTHAHLLIFHPRDARPAALQELIDAGWDTDEIVSLSQLISFLSFQLRTAWGLRVLAARSRSETSSSPEEATDE